MLGLRLCLSHKILGDAHAFLAPHKDRGGSERKAFTIEIISTRAAPSLLTSGTSSLPVAQRAGPSQR